MGGGVWWGQAAGYKGWQVLPAGVRHGRHSGSRPRPICPHSGFISLLFMTAMKIIFVLVQIIFYLETIVIGK